jgi:hypothetical protein
MRVGLPDWPAQVTALITKLRSSKPPSSCSAAASEAHRRFNFKTNRASIRRWAIEHQLNPGTRHKVRHPTPPTNQPSLKNAPSCDQHHTARGGFTFGASKPASGSATTSKSPSAPNGILLTLHPAPPSAAASAPMETFTTSATPRTKMPNPSSCSIAPSSERIPTLIAHSFPTLFDTRGRVAAKSRLKRQAAWSKDWLHR